jgi:hypothetical protein
MHVSAAIFHQDLLGSIQHIRNTEAAEIIRSSVLDRATIRDGGSADWT